MAAGIKLLPQNILIPETIMYKYTALLVDDDVQNIKLLKLLLNKFCKDVKIVSKKSNVEDAIEAYYTFKPDIIFLDIHLGDSNCSSFSILERINNIESEIIFVTSYDQFALKALNCNATAYILKPVTNNELINAVNKAIKNCDNKRILHSKKAETTNTNGFAKLIAIPSPNVIELIRTEDIVYLEADNRYTVFHMADGSVKIASKNLGKYEKILNPTLFFRIHHRYIINLNMTININKSAGNYCEMLNKKALPIARRKQDKLAQFLNLR